jgi:hypothetical protein
MPERRLRLRALRPFVLAGMLALFVGCGVPFKQVSTTDATTLGNLEFQRLKGQGVPVTNVKIVVVVDGDLALIGSNPGDHWMTSIYQRSYERWHWVASKGNSPAPCLFVNVHAAAAQAERLTQSLLQVAQHPKPMQLDDWYVPCHSH